MPFLANGSSANYLRPPANELVATPGTGAWTIICWFRLTSTSAFQNIWFANNNHALQTNGSSLEFWYSATDVLKNSLTTGVWYCAGISKNGTTRADYFVDGAAAPVTASRTTSLSSTDTDAGYIGSWDGTDDWPSHHFGPMKIWDAALSTAEMAQESFIQIPVRTANLRAFYPFWNGGSSERVRDYSGNARHLTQTGAAFIDSTVSGPPVPYSPIIDTTPASFGLILSTAQNNANIELSWT